MIERLFVYGTLAPGRANAHLLAEVAGTWQGATVRGTLIPDGWGAALGFPALVPDARGDEVRGWMLESDALGRHWTRLDAFEGEGYRRVLVPVVLDDGREVDAWLYASSGAAPPAA